ncbi:WD40 repeat-like protein [Trametes sanguinea]|nr:WD40 repeat-like protein [Trametes sanguinea]
MRLRPVIQARFDHGSSVHVECHQGTRREVLATVCSWLRRDDPRLHELPAPVVPAQSNKPILWVYALPGVGKSTVARTAAIWWDKDKVLGATFFAARDGQRSNILGIFRTIAYQLARKFPEFCKEITKILQNDPDLYAATPSRQLEKLLAEPLQVEAVQAEFRVHGRVPVVIDALDECTDKAAVSTILTSLALYISDSRLTPLWFLITSRREENITKGFLQRALDENTQPFNLNDVPQDLTKRDIEIFVLSRFEDIRRLSHPTLPSDWPSQSQLTQLLNLADVLFIYAATAMLFIGDEKARDPQGRLDHLLKSGNAAAVSGAASTSPLDNLYVQVLEDALRKLAEDLQAGLPRLLLGTLVLAEERLTPSTLAALVGLPSGVVEASLPVFHAVMTVPAEHDHSTPIRLIHLSFTNFLVDPARCTNPAFLVKPPIQHSFLALRCLRLLQDSLKYNICEVPPEHDHLLNSDIPGLAARITQCLPPAVQYACRYCLHHLGLADIGEELLTALKAFCNTHLLHWLEALSLMGCVDGTAEALRSTQLYLKQRCPEATEVLSLVYDCERMVRAFYPAISGSFMQVYRTAIPFSPTASPLRRLHRADASHVVEVRMGLEKAWSTTLASRATNTTIAGALAFSSDGTHIACCASDEGCIQLLNTHTATQLQVFVGHTDCVNCVSFSPTGKEILSGSRDRTTRLWDVATGACLHTWDGHAGWVFSVAWSLDGALVASGALEGSVIVRMVATPQKMAVLRHNRLVRDVAFATDGTLVSGSYDGSCKIWGTKQLDWDAADHTPSQILQHDQEVWAVAVSPDSCVVACGLFNGETVLWRKSDGQRLHSFPGERYVIALAFYSDSRLAAAYRFTLFVLWDLSTATPLDTVDNAVAVAAAFSPDGVHICIAHAHDGTVQIRRWSGNASPESKSKKATASSPAIRAKRWLHSHLPALRSSPVVEAKADDLVTDVKAVAVSPTGALILAVSNKEWRLWDVSNGQWNRTGKHATSDDTIIAWSPSGNLFAYTDRHHVICAWEAQTGQLVGSFSGHSNVVTAVVFTADEQHLLSASSDGSIRRWKARQTPQEPSCEVLFQSEGDEIDSFCVSSDAQWLLSGSRREDTPPNTSSADLLAKPSRQPVKYCAWYSALRLHDATGRVVWIEHHPSWITSVAFSQDCTRALAGNDEGEVFLYDLTQLIPLDKSAPRSPPPLAVPEYQFSWGSSDTLRQVSFSPDGRGIIAGRRYVRFPAELQHLSTRTASVSSTPAYFMDDDGWFWRIGQDSDSRRLCWLLPQYTPAGGERVRRSPRWQTGGHVLACIAEGCLMVVDAANC